MKTQLKWIAFWLVAIALAGMLLFPGNSLVAAAPLSQMTPAVDPMSTPTVVAPPLSTQNGLPVNTTGTVVGSGQTSCPMMSGSTGTGMSGMSGMTGMGGMSGSMSGSMSMGQMGSMPMTGYVNMNDALSNSQAGFFYSTNPWWLVGWIIVFILVIALLVLIVLGIIWMVKQIRKEKPAVSA